MTKTEPRFYPEHFATLADYEDATKYAEDVGTLVEEAQMMSDLIGLWVSMGAISPLPTESNDVSRFRAALAAFDGGTA